METDYVKLKDIKPALAEYIKEARLLLGSHRLPDEVQIHDVRVLMKKTKAGFRLIAPQIEGDFIGRETVLIREAGRIMSDRRDNSVSRKILKDLKKEHPVMFSKLEESKIIASILKKPEVDETSAESMKLKNSQVVAILNKTGYRLRFEPMKSLDPQLLLKELEVTYNKVVNNYLMSRNSPKPGRIHEFRKKSKEFLYQLWFFRPLNVQTIKRLEKKLDTLTRNLGKYNDIEQLIKRLEYKYEYTLNDPALDEFVVILREQQDVYLAKVWPLAHVLFCPGQRLLSMMGFKFLVI